MFHSTPSVTATCVSCQSVWQLRGTIDNRLLNRQTSNTDTLKSQLQTHAHENPHPLINTSYFLTFSLSLSLSFTHTQTLPVNRSNATLVEVCVLQLWVPCLDLFLCWPVLHEALSACQLSPADCTKPTHGGGGGLSVNCTAGSLKVTDSLGSLLTSFETLQLHQGVLMLCSSAVSSEEKTLCLSLSLLLFPPPPLALTSARKQGMGVTGLEQ